MGSKLLPLHNSNIVNPVLVLINPVSNLLGLADFAILISLLENLLLIQMRNLRLLFNKKFLLTMSPILMLKGKLSLNQSHN
jgi:hypothetical protein